MDSIYEPLVNSCEECIIYCSDSTSSSVEPVSGYIVSNVKFNSDEKIELRSLLPYHPDSGGQNVLFTHFQPNLELDNCNSSNFVVFIEFQALENDISTTLSNKNTQLAMYTGGPFYQFETLSETKGWFEILDISDDIATVKYHLEFSIADENYIALNVSSKIRVLNRESLF